MFITAQGCRLRNDLYCVKWDVKLYYTIPLWEGSEVLRWYFNTVHRTVRSMLQQTRTVLCRWWRGRSWPWWRLTRVTAGLTLGMRTVTAGLSRRRTFSSTTQASLPVSFSPLSSRSFHVSVSRSGFFAGKLSLVVAGVFQICGREIVCWYCTVIQDRCCNLLFVTHTMLTMQLSTNT